MDTPTVSRPQTQSTSLSSAVKSPPRVHTRELEPPAPASLDRFFERLAVTRRRLLFLDYDGTLAPFAKDRFSAHPYPGVREILARIRVHPSTRLVFVSGRPAREMADMLSLSPRPEIWGVHGWERLTATGQLVRAILPAQARRALEHLQSLQPALEGVGALVEVKYASVAVHWRGLPPPAVEEIKQLLTAIDPDIATHEALLSSVHAKRDGAFLQSFDGGLELRAYGPNKGSVVRGVLREEPRDAMAAYLGDDVSDEDAFQALSGRGLAARVLPPNHDVRLDAYRHSAAQIQLKAPDQVLEFLTRWEAVAPRS